jgi:hypothetical protein
VLVGGSDAAWSMARAPWRGGAPAGQQGGGGAHQRGRSMARQKGIAARRSAADGEGPAMAGDNPRVLLQLRNSEGL